MMHYFTAFIIALLIFISEGKNLSQRYLKKRDVSGSASNTINSVQNIQTDRNIHKEADQPWELLLIPAPNVICLLGQLMLMSGNTDFSMAESAPVNGFKYVRHPNSFRATLVQVSNDGWGAFMNAHENMDKIQLSMQLVPDHIKTAFKLIMRGSPRMIRRFLPITLSQLKDIGNNCLKLAKETQNKFNDVMLLMGEILESTKESHGRYNLKLIEAEAELNISKVVKIDLEKTQENLRIRQASIDAELSKYQSAYDKAIKEIPTGWKVIAQELARAGINLINMVSFTAGPVSVNGGINPGQSAAGSSASKALGGDNYIDPLTARVLSSTQQFSGLLGDLKDGIIKTFNGNEVNNQDNPLELFTTFRSKMNIWQNLLTSTGEVGQQAFQLIKDGQGICDTLKKLYKDASKVNVSQEMKSEILGSTDELIEKVKSTIASNAYTSNGMSMSNDGRVSSSDFNGHHGNERFKAYLTLEMLKETQKKSDKMYDHIRSYNEDMKNLMIRMSKLNMDTINFKETIQLIIDGIKLLGGIREQWSMLIQFFSKVSSRAEIALNLRLLPFINYTDVAGQEIVQEGGFDEFERELLKEILSKQTVDIHIECSFLYLLSSTYVDVSDRFLLTRLAGLSKLLASTSEEERQTYRTQLINESKEAEKQIGEISKQKRIAYKSLVQQRINEVSTYMHQIGGPTESDRNAVRIGFDRSKKPGDIYAIEFTSN